MTINIPCVVPPPPQFPVYLRNALVSFKVPVYT